MRQSMVRVSRQSISSTWIKCAPRWAFRRNAKIEETPMRTIYKFTIGASTTLNLSDGWKIVHFADQGGKVCAWIEVDPGKPTAPQALRIVATGENIPDGLAHYGTCLQGPYVWHLYG